MVRRADQSTEDQLGIVSSCSDPVERCKNGVHVSHWLDVVANVDGHPIHILERSDIATNPDGPELVMQKLRDIAVELGP